MAMTNRQALRRAISLQSRAVLAERAFVVAVDGRGGSGKSSLAQHLAATMHDTTVVAMDDLARLAAKRPVDLETIGDWFDRARLVSDVLEPIRAGGSARYQRYDWERDELAEWIEIPSRQAVIIEGISSSAADLQHLVDLTVWVDTDPALCLARGIERDGEGARPMWETVWIPAENAYIAAESPLERADHVITGTPNLR